MKTLEQMAEAYATHAADCTCKGKYRNADKDEAYLAGARAVLEHEAVRGLEDLLESLNIQAIVNGIEGQKLVMARIHTALDAFDKLKDGGES